MGGEAILPADVVVLAVIVRVVEGRVYPPDGTICGEASRVGSRCRAWQCQDVIGAEIRVLDVAECIRVPLPDIRLDPADGEVHDGEAAGGGIALIRLLPPQPHPSGALRTSQMGAPRPLSLPVDGDVPELSTNFSEAERLPL